LFELEGVEVVEDSQTLCRVEEVERIGNTDYLIVKTDKSLLEENLLKMKENLIYTKLLELLKNRYTVERY
jgi:ribosomal 30S subunit maturation factor RimM